MTSHRRFTTQRALAGLLLCLGLSACGGTPPHKITEKEDWLYGYGSGSTREEAEAAALHDLVEKATASTILERRGIAVSVSVDPAVLPKLKLKTKLVAEETTETGENVAIRAALEDWRKELASRESTLRDKGQALLSTLAKEPLKAGNLKETAALCERLNLEGLGDLVTIEGKADILLKDALEAASLVSLATVSISIEGDKRIISSGEVLDAQIRDVRGEPITQIPLRWTWLEPDSPETPVVQNIMLSDQEGRITITLPPFESSAPTRYRLAIESAFASLEGGSLAFLDGRLAIEENYLLADDMLSLFGPFIDVPEGSFEMGAAPGERSPRKREERRTVTTGAYALARFPLTNYQYELFLHVNPEAEPGEYRDNPAYNQADQPLTGISAAQAEALCAWLSESSGKKVRLPSEAEWEKAAKAGGAGIYPWGDQSPREGPMANYLGNGRFRAPSPSGSFPSSLNPWGFEDMAGNVWEMVTLTAEESDIPAYGAKGGSWMEGPTDLRIANRRDIDRETRSADIGVRILVEVEAE